MFRRKREKLSSIKQRFRLGHSLIGQTSRDDLLNEADDLEELLNNVEGKLTPMKISHMYTQARSVEHRDETKTAQSCAQTGVQHAFIRA